MKKHPRADFHLRTAPRNPAGDLKIPKIFSGKKTPSGRLELPTFRFLSKR